MAKVYREKFRAYGMRAETENLEILRFLTIVMALIFIGMIFTLITLMVRV